MNETQHTTQENKIVSKPLRYLAIVGSSAKSCRRLKLLLKTTAYYCLVDRYKNSKELIDKESFYIPDCVILEASSLFSMFFIAKQIEKLKEAFPGIKILIYYNMVKRYPLLEQKHKDYPSFYLTEEEKEQVGCIETLLRNNAF